VLFNDGSRRVAVYTLVGSVVIGLVAAALGAAVGRLA